MAVGTLRRLGGRLGIVLAAVLGLLVWALATLLATRPAFKQLWDLSPAAHFSVTGETEALLRDLRGAGQAIRIDTFYSPLPRPRAEYEAHQISILSRIRQLTDDLLMVYSNLGGDAFEVEHQDVVGDVARARERIGELGGLSIENCIVVSLGKRHKVLSLALDLADIDEPAARQATAPGARPAFPSLKTYKGEEAVSSAIRTLLVEGEPKVYFLSSDVSLTAGIGNSYSELVGALSDDGFEIAVLDLEREPAIPEDAAIVALMEPERELSEPASDALFAFLKRGGQVFLNVVYVELPKRDNPKLDQLGRLCGFELGQDLVCHTVSGPSGQMGGPLAQNLRIDDLSPAHPITRPLLASRRYPVLKAAREIRGRAGGSLVGVRFESILTTGPGAWIAPRLGGDGEVDLALPQKPDAFAPRCVGAVIDVDSDDPQRPGHLVIVSGVAFLNGGGFGVNGDLALNVFNWMAERKELITIRGNRYRAAKLELTPVQIDRTKWLLRLYVPLGLLALALGVFFFRSRRA